MTKHIYAKKKIAKTVRKGPYMLSVAISPITASRTIKLVKDRKKKIKPGA
jgi:hypothetical protein